MTPAQQGSVKVVTSPSTTVRKTAAGALSDISPGDTVTIQGTRNADGSFTATAITIVPAGFAPGSRFGTGCAGGAPPSTTTP